MINCITGRTYWIVIPEGTRFASVKFAFERNKPQVDELSFYTNATVMGDSRESPPEVISELMVSCDDDNYPYTFYQGRYGLPHLVVPYVVATKEIEKDQEVMLNLTGGKVEATSFIAHYQRMQK